MSACPPPLAEGRVCMKDAQRRSSHPPCRLLSALPRPPPRSPFLPSAAPPLSRNLSLALSSATALPSPHSPALWSQGWSPRYHRAPCRPARALPHLQACCPVSFASRKPPGASQQRWEGAWLRGERAGQENVRSFAEEISPPPPREGYH